MITENTVSSDKVEILAPATLVWSILLDFDNYHLWNTFCPQVKNRAVEIGEAVDMMVDLGNGLQQQVEYISLIEPGKRIAWGMENKPADPIHAMRYQTITPIDENRCTYVTVDEFSGEALVSMMELMAIPVETGFNKCAYGLKAFAEARYSSAQQPSPD